MHVKKKGYKHLDKIIETNGLSVSEEYLFKNESSKLRTHMSCKVGILLLFTHNSRLQGEDNETASRLRCYLIDMLLGTVLNTAEYNTVHNELNSVEPLRNQSSLNAPSSPPPQLETGTSPFSDTQFSGPLLPENSSFSHPPSSVPLLQPTTPASSSFSNPPSFGPLLQPHRKMKIKQEPLETNEI
nr:uncharacterized protein LOC131771825 [Pocillopora verrucosa]